MILNLNDYFVNGDKWLYDHLKSIRQDSFPTDFRLYIQYDQDNFINNTSTGVALTKLQELLALLDFSNFFVTIKTSYKNIARDLNTLNKLYSPHDTPISYNLTETTFDEIYLKGDSVCIYPWIHLYINPQGQVGTCCAYDGNYPLGSIKNDSIKSLINGDNLKLVRLQMLRGERPNICSACWKSEDAGLESPRQIANKKWSRYLDLVDATSENGSVHNFKLRYFDFRASNVCNLKCIMCSGKFSSSIAAEEASIYGDKSMIELRLDQPEIAQTLKLFEENIVDLDEVYFAGGEPLLMKEHYDILDLLIKHNRTDIKILYSTNLTTLKYKSKNVVDYWSKFTNITTVASIDLIGPQAEYVRFGTNYKELENNYYAIKDFVNFRISSIVHMLNVFNLPKLQYHWLNNVGIKPTQMSISFLLDPSFMNLQVLPGEFKQKAKNCIESHMGWLSTLSDAKHLVSRWEEVLQYMYLKDESYRLPEFFRVNDYKDQHRNTSFESVFPEYNKLRNYV